MTSGNLQPVGGCQACRGSVSLRLDIGRQPLCHRLRSKLDEPELTHPFRLGQCEHCGLLQQIDPIAASELKPTKPLRYTEPESHLDEVVNRLIRLPGIHSDSPICGITSKDQTTIDRFRARGFRQAFCLDPIENLGITDPTAGIETIQQQIAGGRLQERLEQRAYQLVIARHILEHAHRLHNFVHALEGLLVPGGYLMFEVPDFTTSLRHGDYSTLWEEHVCYFTPASLTSALQSCGLVVHEAQNYPYVPEESLVAVTTAQDRPQKIAKTLPSDALGEQLAIAQGYATGRTQASERWQHLLEEERRAGRQTALLGAGHLGVMFIQALGLAKFIDVVTDDDPEKCGRYLPGSHHLVHDMSALYERPIKLCLVSVSPEGEHRVLQRHRQFTERGGQFRSIFPTSPLACFPAAENRP